VSPVQTVSLVGGVTTIVGWPDVASLAIGLLVGAGSLAAALLALAANRRANRVAREFQDWQKAQAEPYPVIAWLTVSRVRNTVVGGKRKIEDGYAISVVVYNAGNAPLVVQIAKCMLFFGEAAYGDLVHFKGDPLVIPRTGLSTIRLACERHERVPAEWPDKVSMILKYVGGRDVDGKHFEWNLLEVIGPDANNNVRIADLDRLSEVTVDGA